MSWVFIISVAALLVAVVLIELRAIRAGDERERHAPGYALVMGGLVVIGLGVAAAVAEQMAPAILASLAGLGAVLLGVTRHAEAAAH